MMKIPIPGKLKTSTVIAKSTKECLRPVAADPSTILPATIPPKRDSNTPAKKNTDSKYTGGIELRLKLKWFFPAKAVVGATVGSLLRGAMNWDVIIRAITKKMRMEMYTAGCKGEAPTVFPLSIVQVR